MENNKKHFNKKSSKHVDKINKTKVLDLEIEEINKRLETETPPSGYYYSQHLNDETNIIDDAWKKQKLFFKDLVLSKKTLRGLEESKFRKMTPIQKSSLPHSLAGRDILGASKTGSGKTLCFIIPVLEHLYRNKWTPLDGLGALIILPTRELAMQVFEVIKLAGKYHDFSCGLAIGGNDLEQEKEHIYNMNILIGTPGRIAQHFTETAYLNTDNLKLLVIDEADRILDSGFEEALNDILSYLPNERLTLLFSATLTKSLKRLAKVNMKTPEYINLNNAESLVSNTEENAIDKINIAPNLAKGHGTTNDASTVPDDIATNNSITPVNLNQYYAMAEAHEKVDILFSFLQSHKTSKCLVFLSSCKQVRYYYEVFRRLKLGMTFLDLHGKQKQGKRTNIFYTFLNKKNTVLFATDVAARGVDFPAVDWVIQLDCPEDMASYVHRVGRTARFKSKGNSILFVSAKEEKFVEYLNGKQIPIKKIKINQKKMVNLQPIVRSIISENPELVYLAQKTMASYIKSIYLQHNKDVFDIQSLDIEKLSLSLGLMTTPELRLGKTSQNNLKNMRKDNFAKDEDMDVEEDSEKPKDQNATKKLGKLAKLKEKIKNKKLQKQNEQITNQTSNTEQDLDGDGFLQKKRKPNKEHDHRLNLSVNKLNNKTNADEEEQDEVAMTNHYEKIKSKLAINRESDQIKEKIRLHDKRIKDKRRQKEADYLKHGIRDDDDDEGLEEEGVQLDQGYQEEELESFTKKPSKYQFLTIDKVKIKSISKDATIEEKERAALEILTKTNPLFD